MKSDKKEPISYKRLTPTFHQGSMAFHYSVELFKTVLLTATKPLQDTQCLKSQNSLGYSTHTHTILVFLCRRAVVLVALLLYNGHHSGFSEWQQAERNHGPGLWLPLPFVYLTHTQIHVIVCTHIFSNPFMWPREGGCETVYDHLHVSRPKRMKISATSQPRA